MRPALKALKSDLYAIEDRAARKRAAVKVLEELGYAVTLERRPAGMPRPAGAEPHLKLVRPPEPASPPEE